MKKAVFVFSAIFALMMVGCVGDAQQPTITQMPTNPLETDVPVKEATPQNNQESATPPAELATDGS